MVTIPTGAMEAESTTPPQGGRTRRGAGISLTVAVVVLLAAEITVRLVHQGLVVPNVWPLPELQVKYGQIIALAHSRQRPDVLLVGDSEMDAAGAGDVLNQIDPRHRTYNAALAGAVLPVISDWTTKIVVPELHPKVVVIGLPSNELNPHIFAAATTVAYRQSRVVRAAEGIGSPIDRTDAWLRQKSMLYRYRNTLRHPFKPSQVDSIPAVSPTGQDLDYADKSDVDTGTPRLQAILAQVKIALQGFSIGSDNVSVLQAMILSLLRQRIAVVLVAMPSSPEYVSLHPAGEADYQRAMDTFGAIAERTGIRFEQPGSWPRAMFGDPVHLNRMGAVRFTAYLAGVLNGLEAALDRRR